MSYWCAEQLVVTIEGPGGRSVVSLAQPFARVGRHPESDVVLHDRSVASRCVYLHATPDGVFCLYLDVEIQDLEQKGTWLHPEQEVPIGPYRLRASLLTAEPDDTPPTTSLAAWGSVPPPLPVMMVSCGARLKDKRRFRARLNPLGRRPQCALQLKGQNVSAFHCVLYWERQQLWCIDLNSSNGTQLNGENVVCGEVKLGDRVDVGEFALVFQRLSRGGVPATESAPAELPWPAPPTPIPALPAASGPPRGPTPADLATDEEQRRLREQLAEEAARLSRERQEMQARFEQTSRQLLDKIGQSQEESVRLAEQRQELEQSRQQWHDERTALARQLDERSNQMSRLEAELSATTASLTAKLAEVERQPQQPLQPPGPSPRELEAQWHATTQRLTAEIQQLRTEAAQVSVEQQALETSRDEWRSERESLTRQFADRQEQIARLETELSATKSSFSAKLQEVESLVQHPAAPSTPLAPPTAAEPAEREDLPRFVSDRLSELSAQRSGRWIWWTLGGIGVAVILIAIGLVVWKLAF